MVDNPTPAASRAELQELVAEADTGGRRLSGFAGRLVAAIAVAWSLFQVWYASPLPFALNIGVFGDTEARAFHLAFALALVFAGYPAFARSPRDRIPLTDLLLAGAAIACVLYLVVFYRDIAQRPGLPSTADIVVSVVGVILLI